MAPGQEMGGGRGKHQVCACLLQDLLQRKGAAVGLLAHRLELLDLGQYWLQHHLIPAQCHQLPSATPSASAINTKLHRTVTGYRLHSMAVVHHILERHEPWCPVEQ